MMQQGCQHKLLVNGKAAGESVFVGEFLKAISAKVTYFVYKNGGEEKDTVPNGWGSRVVLPWHKKDDKINPYNYRVIIFMDVVRNRIERVFMEMIAEEHGLVISV
jgi:hypothetical protein